MVDLLIMHVYLSAYNRLSTLICLFFKEQMYVMVFLSVSFSANEVRRLNITFIILRGFFSFFIYLYLYIFSDVFLKVYK